MFSERWAIIRYSCKAVVPQMLSLIPRPPLFLLFGLHFTRIHSGRMCVSVNINQGIKWEGPRNNANKCWGRTKIVGIHVLSKTR